MKFALLTAALLLPMAETARTPEPAAPPVAAQSSAPDMVSPDRLGCVPIVRQVAGEDRPPVGTRLDQQPPAKAMLAVDRQVNGCREVTLIARERARSR